ncbi:hypothetical protein [Litorisediminicola beolgyonensis]|uniref:Uncharacterized protein n=1 Tax=Litorisediminicola beolgyonensis TaxID=1173614 RepID=A0ABW3ZIF8_9RHOB
MAGSSRASVNGEGLSRDLGAVQEWCRHVHSEAPTFDICAVAKICRKSSVLLVPHIPNDQTPIFEGPILETARRAIEALGYMTEIAGPATAGAMVYPWPLTAHERMTAIRLLGDKVE